MVIGKTLFKQYKIIQEIGNGAFGKTYLAIDTAFPGEPRRVVKHLCPHNIQPEALQIAKKLFKNEAKSLSRLGEHDCIPRLYSYFEEDGEFYLVQDFITGHDLAQEFKTGQKWSEAETVKLLQELLEILTHVHQENTIHRDIKPANIMRRDSDGKLVLIDFGAVKEILTVDNKGQTNLTVGIGTVSYMPPEQAMGRPGKYSDVYAVGMLGIQATSSLASRDLPTDSDELERIWNNLDIQISPELKSALDRMVRLNHQERYQDAAEALKAVTPTVIENQEQSNNAPAATTIISHPTRKLWFLIAGTIGLLGVGMYALLPLITKPNYTQLKSYLANEQWQQADAESDRLLLQAAGKSSSLDADSIDKLSCKTLQTIDEMWLQNSDGRFGFTPQKKAYQQTGNQFGQHIESTYEKFGDRLKWRTFDAWSLYGDLKFTKLAPPGHLPSPGRSPIDSNALRFNERLMLLSRVHTCNS